MTTARERYEMDYKKVFDELVERMDGSNGPVSLRELFKDVNRVTAENNLLEMEGKYSGSKLWRFILSQSSAIYSPDAMLFVGRALHSGAIQDDGTLDMIRLWLMFRIVILARGEGSDYPTLVAILELRDLMTPAIFEK